MEDKYVFAVYVKKNPIREAKTTKEKFGLRYIRMGQNYMFNAIFKNLGNAKAPKDETEGNVYFVDTKENCLKNESEFWESGTVAVIEEAKKNIAAKRYPKIVRTNLTKIVDKNQKIADIFRMFCGYFSVVVTTKVDSYETFMANKDNSDYFLTPKELPKKEPETRKKA